MISRISKWGNSLGLRIPRALAREIEMEEGSTVDLSLKQGSLVVRVLQEEQVDLEDLLAQVTDENRHGEIDTGEAVGGESW